MQGLQAEVNILFVRSFWKVLKGRYDALEVVAVLSHTPHI